MHGSGRLSKRQSAALALVLCAGTFAAFVAAAGPTPPPASDPAASAAEAPCIPFAAADAAALLCTPALPPQDVVDRLREVARNPNAPFSAFERRWTPAQAAVIERYVALPATVAPKPPTGPVIKLHRHTRHFHLWP
ncbi:MAG: hypothetical protein ACREJ2_16290 [Planctomycetota bacterium]